MSAALRPVLVVARATRAAVLLDDLGMHGWLPLSVNDLEAAAAVLRTRRFDVALLFLEGAQPEAARRLEACVQAAPHCRWIGVLTPGEDRAAPWRDALVAHCCRTVEPPADVAVLCHALEHAWNGAAQRREEPPAPLADDMGMVGRSPALQRLRAEIRKAGAADAPVLIAGESGTGKELVARALHRYSGRARGPFVPVNCGALPPTLIHNELFGHERGSFSGATSARRGLLEAASGGTLFLDEIAELPVDTQATLLRFLQEGRFMRVGSLTETQVDARVIAASHVDLTAAAVTGRFRSDLLFRLDVLRLAVPPLRERRQDIPLLARHVFEHRTARLQRPARGFHADALAAMADYDWPGNVRELFNRVHRAVVMSEGALIRPEDLGLAGVPVRATGNLADVRVQAERDAIVHTLERMSQNVTLAARELGVSRMTLYRLMAKHSISSRAH